MKVMRINFKKKKSPWLDDVGWPTFLEWKLLGGVLPVTLSPSLLPRKKKKWPRVFQESKYCSSKNPMNVIYLRMSSPVLLYPVF